MPEDPILLILWAEPYLSWFSEHFGGLPANWLSDGVVTSLNICRAQQAKGVASGWALHELKVAGYA